MDSIDVNKINSLKQTQALVDDIVKTNAYAKHIKK